MKNVLWGNYIELSDFLIRKNFYREQYKKALSQKLYDFLIILTWKTFMLFAYEKIQQTRYEKVVEQISYIIDDQEAIDAFFSPDYD